MTCSSDHEERRRQIAVLLDHPKVGPLSAATIAINLGASEDEIRAPLESLVREGRLLQTKDGRFASASPLSPGRTAWPDRADNQGKDLETRARE